MRVTMVEGPGFNPSRKHGVHEAPRDYPLIMAGSASSNQEDTPMICWKWWKTSSNDHHRCALREEHAGPHQCCCGDEHDDNGPTGKSPPVF